MQLAERLAPGLFRHQQCLLLASSVRHPGSRQAYSTSGRFSFEIRSYRARSQFSTVAIGYENGRLSDKTAVWSY